MTSTGDVSMVDGSAEASLLGTHLGTGHPIADLTQAPYLSESTTFRNRCPPRTCTGREAGSSDCSQANSRSHSNPSMGLA